MYSKFTYPPLLYKESLFILVVEGGYPFPPHLFEVIGSLHSNLFCQQTRAA